MISVIKLPTENLLNTVPTGDACSLANSLAICLWLVRLLYPYDDIVHCVPSVTQLMPFTPTAADRQCLLLTIEARIGQSCFDFISMAS